MHISMYIYIWSNQIPLPPEGSAETKALSEPYRMTGEWTKCWRLRRIELDSPPLVSNDLQRWGHTSDASSSLLVFFFSQQRQWGNARKLNVTALSQRSHISTIDRHTHMQIYRQAVLLRVWPTMYLPE